MNVFTDASPPYILTFHLVMKNHLFFKKSFLFVRFVSPTVARMTSLMKIFTFEAKFDPLYYYSFRHSHWKRSKIKRILKVWINISRIIDTKNYKCTQRFEDGKLYRSKQKVKSNFCLEEFRFYIMLRWWHKLFQVKIKTDTAMNQILFQLTLKML